MQFLSRRRRLDFGAQFGEFLLSLRLQLLQSRLEDLHCLIQLRRDFRCEPLYPFEHSIIIFTLIYWQSVMSTFTPSKNFNENQSSQSGLQQQKQRYQPNEKLFAEINRNIQKRVNQIQHQQSQQEFCYQQKIQSESKMRKSASNYIGGTKGKTEMVDRIIAESQKRRMQY